MQNGVAGRVRDELEEAILSGRLPPGARVNADDQARRLGVSHIPVREALHALAADGWIVHRRHQGAFVRAHDPAERADLFESRWHLEGTVAALAAGRRTAPQLAALGEILARQAATSDPGELARINAEFHVGIADCAQNAMLAVYLRDLSKRVRFYFVPGATARRTDSLAEHRAILDALRDRDGERARVLVQAHITDTRVALAGPVGVRTASGS